MSFFSTVPPLSLGLCSQNFLWNFYDKNYDGGGGGGKVSLQNEYEMLRYLKCFKEVCKMLVRNAQEVLNKSTKSV